MASFKNRKNSEDERLQRWLEWYDRQSLRRDVLRRCSLPPKAFAKLTRGELEDLFRDRIRSGWSHPNRRRHQAVQGYRKLVISLLIQRDGRRCGICGQEVPLGKETIDHIIQKSAGGRDDATNVRLACNTCNIRRPRKEQISLQLPN